MIKKNIDSHPLLTDSQRTVCAALNRVARSKREEFTMLDFARIALRATGNDYASAIGSDDLEVYAADREHKRAAILYVYEALKATEHPLIQDWTGLPDCLKVLKNLAEELP